MTDRHLIEKISLPKLLLTLILSSYILILYVTLRPAQYKVFRSFVRPTSPNESLWWTPTSPNNRTEVEPQYLIDTPGCQIINLNPFDPSVRQFVKLESLPKCEKSFVISSDGVRNFVSMYFLKQGRILNSN